jgi:hypothetical protein
MVTWWRTFSASLGVASALWCAPVFAEGEDGDEEEVYQPASDDEAEAPTEVARPAPRQLLGEPQASENHVVRSGDTLWDLCSKYLNSPWYWPKIWSYNPQISNPHWIYPGNELHFYPGDEALPTAVAVSRAMTAEEQPDSTFEDETPSEVDAEELVTTAGAIQAARPAPNSVWSSHQGFMSSADHERSGVIQNSQSESVMLSDLDTVYLKMKETPKRGQRFAIYRTIREITHPMTGEPFGYAVEIVGGVQVIEAGSSVATAQIAQSFRPVERGDFVGKWPESFGARVAPIQGDTETKGYIVDTMGDAVGAIGEHTVVFIDRGREHGLQKGNVLSVVDRMDGYTRETEGLPIEDVGQVMVIDVQDRAATAVVTFAVRELAVGDKVELRRP